MKINAVLIAALLSVSSLAAPQAQNPTLLQKAHQAYLAAQALEAELNEKPEPERTRAEYLKVISAFQRVYIITPHTGYADNLMMTIARLYAELNASVAALTILALLIS